MDFERIGCHVPLLTNNGRQILAGLHPAAGGNGTAACSGEMLLQALVSCAGTTLAAVATSMGLQIHTATVKAVGKMDFRGTMGVSRETPAGMT
ncbi:MAG: OsmC family protein, partial [Planctomycetaceae bacterium]